MWSQLSVWSIPTKGRCTESKLSEGVVISTKMSISNNLWIATLGPSWYSWCWSKGACGQKRGVFLLCDCERTGVQVLQLWLDNCPLKITSMVACSKNMAFWLKFPSIIRELENGEYQLKLFGRTCHIHEQNTIIIIFSGQLSGHNCMFKFLGRPRVFFAW